jgi:2-polyprenyl-6-methoxyphenol hydroxylase-like FAD-dependent oxidoreductase
LRARYVVGCDGAHSSLRGSVGIPFEGATYPESFVLADVRMDWHLPDDEVQLFFSPEGLVVVAPLPGERRHRIVATVDEAPTEPSLEDVFRLCSTPADPERLGRASRRSSGRRASGSATSWPPASARVRSSSRETPRTCTTRPAGRG